jgi:hypothetical protein
MSPENIQEPLVKFREYQVEPFWKDDVGLFVLSWRRRGGKSHCMASKSLRQMMETKGILNIFMSASIPLGQEFIRKEFEVWQSVMTKYRAATKANGQRLESNVDGLDIDAFCDIFEHGKLETKIWHDRTTYSRSKVIAPNPGTAVGYGGNLYVDEYGRIENFKEILEAVLPFIEDNPNFRAMMASTPPPDDDHYSWELTAPKIEEFETNPRGNWYVSDADFLVHRVDAWDAHAAGQHLYSKGDRRILTPEEHRASYFDKAAWDRNYGVRFLRGGQAAINAAALATAMARGEIGVAVDVTERVEL